MLDTSTRSTADRILQAGCGVFSEHGNRGTTPQAISGLARASSAAVNDGNGSKERLHRPAWEHGGRKAARLRCAPGPAGGSPEECLHALISGEIAMALDEGELGWLARLVHGETASPGVTERRIRLAGFCLHGSLVHRNEIHRRASRLPALPEDRPWADSAALTETIHTFAVAGLRQSRCQYRENVR